VRVLSATIQVVYPHINDVLMMMMTNRKAALQEMLAAFFQSQPFIGEG
jgi:hypothetical protein